MAQIYFSGPRSERRRFPRYPVHMDCQVHFGDRSLTAVLEDISLGGAGIRLPNIVTSYGKIDAPRFQLSNVGFFKSDIRWRSDRRAGLRFDIRAHRSTALNALIARLEQEVTPLPEADLMDQALSREMTTVTSGFFPTSS
ncbi:PilZ domain-containing protein [Pseudooceanicola algae]|uniref:PilZ domain-containing protein n=1 Tax=Pseudooceanicola algae TaxID=1537215 RepID=A0A418SF51_9RHOB|nr:PilZ domain-containing protein [Pseudooceanicola algae]QPM89291.1 hypothetical protein PSAL_005060 [Pseudooceanicola algae]